MKVFLFTNLPSASGNLIANFPSPVITYKYLIYTRWRIPHCGQAKIEAGSQALVVPTELTWSMTICVFCIAKMDKVDDKSSFMQLKSN